MSVPFLHEAESLHDELVAIRRDLHMHPELGFQEFRTANIVAAKLDALGYEVQTGVGQTGVVGILQGDLPGERTVLLRFDMDALPIDEANDVSYRSQTPGVMHACGHDAHVAVGIGVATLFARHRDQVPGTIKLMFQPAEEGLGGAVAMIADGLLESPVPDIALGLHVSSGHPLGTAVVRDGALMAASDPFRIIVHGKGGHGAQPHQTVDAVLVGAQIVVALQTIVARNLNPEETGVVTIGAFQSGEAGNVIAESAELRGTIRSFSPEIQELLHRRVREVAEGIAQTLGATADVQIRFGVDATVNAPAPTAVTYQSAAAVLGEEKINTTFRTTGGEDFSAVLAKVPGCYFFLGSSSNEATSFPHHNPRFDIDEACLPQGVAILCDTAMRCLNGEG
ncbi:amidohydrolase [Candidatus Chloroploca sp. M-50]|uniref:Amidohydrolase n=1 Tax=Candidatus Chloroploca mongolica TaxID=2528176 RepID=A0ABS4D7P5_9CHLR|nr:M20 family metallopeptidase [Candidatus Chloroploca mongolica]MBP1465466.1 amidohydrolase [Candidatus Chloroploca mongolica]